MRMHTHGKCTPTIILGIIQLDCIVIVLYNYWAISTLNHDLILKVHSLEDRIISISKSNDALQVNLEKVEEVKEKVEGNLKKEQLVDQKAREELGQKDDKIKSLQNDLENSKQAAQNCRDDLVNGVRVQDPGEIQGSIGTKVEGRVPAQLVEGGNKVTRMEKELKEAQKQLSQKIVSSTSKTVSFGKAPVPAPAVDVAHQDVKPVFDRDLLGAVPYPKGWMEPQGSVHHPKIHVNFSTEGDNGIQRTRKMGPVIILDPPNLPRLKARFSVLDPPKNEMKPEAGTHFKQPDSLHKPLTQVQEDANPNGGEDIGQQQALGVLPVPGQKDPEQHGPNLDAAEDDGDRPLKEDFGMQDDQSPDGALSAKEMNTAIQAPDMKHHENADQLQQLPFDNRL